MIHLTVLTHKGTYLDEDVLSFTVPTEKGPLMVEGGYTNLITSCLPSGVMKIVREKSTSYYAIFNSSLRIAQGKATLLAELVEDGYEIDMARAIAGRDRAADRLEKKEENLDVKRAKASMMRALTRIKAKDLSEGKLN